MNIRRLVEWIAFAASSARPALHWLDLDHLQAVLGNVRSLTPQIAQSGPVHITFIYRGANPSLD